MEKKYRVGVIGGGSWSTAIIKILSNNLEQINWWMRNENAVEHIAQYHQNPRYLSSVYLNTEQLNVSTDLQEVIDKSDILIMGIPSAFITEVFENNKYTGLDKKIIFSLVKGIIPEYNAIPARYAHKHFGTPYKNIGMISGPCHAEEVALEKLSYLTVACQDENHANTVADFLNCRYVNTTTSSDLFGTELSAVLKNIFALASGVCHGLGYGDNFQAVLVTNAIQEIKSFVDTVNPIHRDVTSSAYLGDLLVTAYSNFSRNRTFGTMIGKGYSIKTAQYEMNMTAEGYYAVKSIIEMNKKFQVDIPITEAIYRILYERISPTIEIKLLEDKLS